MKEQRSSRSTESEFDWNTPEKQENLHPSQNQHFYLSWLGRASRRYPCSCSSRQPALAETSRGSGNQVLRLSLRLMLCCCEKTSKWRDCRLPNQRLPDRRYHRTG